MDFNVLSTAVCHFRVKKRKKKKKKLVSWCFELSQPHRVISGLMEKKKKKKKKEEEEEQE